MKDWNPHLYLQFEAERTRPAQELLSRIFCSQAQRISDLGCGPGNSTELLYRAYPQASVVGVDNSAAMLEQAKQRLPKCSFQQADISSWRPEMPQDIIYENASLQWVPEHGKLMIHLLEQLASGGVLAFQIPNNFEQPSHVLMRKVAAESQWATKYDDSVIQRKKSLFTTEGYYDLLVENGCRVDIWCTTYYHVMPSVTAIIEWLKSTGLWPYLAPLNDVEQPLFLQRYQSELEQAYLPRADGCVLLAFPRLFVVANKS